MSQKKVKAGKSNGRRNKKVSFDSKNVIFWKLDQKTDSYHLQKDAKNGVIYVTLLEKHNLLFQNNFISCTSLNKWY